MQQTADLRTPWLRATLTVVAALAELGLAYLGFWGWSMGVVRVDADPATSVFGLLAVSALAGVVVMAILGAAAVDQARGRSGLRRASAAWSLAFLRVVAIPITAAILVVTVGPDSVLGPFTTPLFILVAGDALVGVFAAVTTRNLARKLDGQRMGLPPVTGTTAPEM